MKQILASLLLFCAALAGAQTVPSGTPQEYGIAARNPASGNFYYVPLDAVGKLYTTSVGYTGAATSVSGYIPPVALVGVGPSGFIYLNADASGNLQVDVTTTTDVDSTSLQGIAISANAPTTSQVLQYNGSVWIPATLSGTGTVTSIATTGPITGGTITSTGTIACPTCGITTNPLSQFNATTSSQLAGIISDETGSGSLVFSNGATLNTVTISSIFTLSAFTGTQCLHEVAGVVGVTGADCGSGGGGGGGSFSAITTGTNTNALTVGSGGTLNFSGSGTINASSLGGNAAANFATLAGVQSFTAAQTNSVNGAASTAAQAFTGAPYSAGTATTNFPLVYINSGTGPTSFSTAGTAFGINGPSGFTGNLMDLHLNGGASLYSVNYQGLLSTVAETLTGGSFTGTQCLHEVSGVIAVTGSDCGSVASVAFSGVTAATNTNPLLIGSGGSLGVSGSGTISATSAINLSGTGTYYAPYQNGAASTGYITAPTTNSHVFVYAWSPTGVAVAPAALDLATYLSSPPAIGGVSASTGTFSQMTVTPPSGDSGYINMPGNTVNQSVLTNTIGWMGPTVASFTSYALQMPSIGPTNTNNTLQCGTPSSGISACTFGVGGGGGSSNLVGGAVGSAVYQSAANTTAFLASPTTSGHTFVMGWLPSGSALAPTTIDLGTYLSNPPTIGGSTPGVATFSQLTVIPPSGDSGYIAIPGNTTAQSVIANTAGFMGPTSASFTGYAMQMPSTGPSNADPILSCATPSGGISTCNFVANGSGAGTVTSSPQYQIPVYSASGSNTIVTGSTSLLTDASGDLSVATPVSTAIANSPNLSVCGVYESTSGPTYSGDCWTSSVTIGTGVNGFSVFSIAHTSGTGGFLQITLGGLVQAPNINSSGNVSSNLFQSYTGATTSAVFQGGQDGGNAGATEGSGTFRGGNNPSSTGTAGDGILEAGDATVAGGVQGKANVQQSFTVASALGATFEVVATTTTGDRVAASTAGNLYNNIGVAQTVGGTNTQLYVATTGKTTVRFDGTPVIGDIACTPTTTTGLAHDNGSVPCIQGGQLGMITGQVSGTGSGSTATVLLGFSQGLSSVIAAGIVDGQAPVTITTGASATLGGTYSSGYTINHEATASAAVTYTLPTAVIGKQYCVKNGNNGASANTSIITIQTSAAGQSIVYNGTVGASDGNLVSGGMAGDAACVLGISTTQWEAYAQVGTWTVH